jgi:uncharacterized membrane protein
MENEQSKIPIFIFAGLALLGIADSFYLTMKELTQTPASCSIIEGCDVVLNSSYSFVGPIPLAVFGLLYYGFVFFALMIFLSRPHLTMALRLASWAVIVGFLFSLYFLYLQAFVIGAFCQYCLLSAGLSVIMLFFAIRFLRT